MGPFLTRSHADLNAALARMHPGESVVFIVGATISVPPPSNLPSVETFKAGVFDALSQIQDVSKDSFLVRLIDRYRTKEFWQELKYKQGRQLPFEAFLGALHEATPKAVEQIFAEGFCSSSFRQPNFNHQGLVACARNLTARGVHVDVVTTNYDLCLESAFQQCGLPLGRVPHGSGRARILTSPIGAGVTLRKLHGSADDFKSMVLTFRAVSQCRIDPSIKRALECLQAAKVIIVAGYSGSDLDVRPAMGAILAEHAGTELYWLHHDESKFWADIEGQPFRRRFVETIAKWSGLVPCNLLVSDHHNCLAAFADTTIATQGGADFPAVIERAVGQFSPDDVRLFLAFITESLESSDAIELLDRHPRRLALAHLVLEAHTHRAENDKAIELGGQFLTDRRLRPWQRARLAARCATDRIMQGKYTQDLLPLNRRAVWEYSRAWIKTPHLWGLLVGTGPPRREFRDADEAEDYEAALDAQYCLLHNLIRVAALAAKRPRGVLRSLVLWPWRPAAWWVVRRLKRCARKRPSLRDEGSMLREVLEARCYTGKFPAGTPKEQAEIEHVLEILGQVEAGHAIACVHLTLGRGYTFRRKLAEALREFLFGLKWVAGGEEHNTIRKCAGNAARLAFFLRDGQPASHPNNLAKPAAPRAAYDYLINSIDAYLTGVSSAAPAELLFAEYLAVTDVAKREEAEREFLGKANPCAWPFLF